MSKDLALITKGELSRSETNLLNKNQAQLLLQRTPKKYVRKRPAKGGGEWEYVTGGYVKKVLNLMFGFDWDFQILDRQVYLESKEVVVHGRLTCRVEGGTIVKEQFGNKDIVTRKNSNTP